MAEKKKFKFKDPNTGKVKEYPDTAYWRGITKRRQEKYNKLTAEQKQRIKDRQAKVAKRKADTQKKKDEVSAGKAAGLTMHEIRAKRMGMTPEELTKKNIGTAEFVLGSLPVGGAAIKGGMAAVKALRGAKAAKAAGTAKKAATGTKAAAKKAAPKAAAKKAAPKAAAPKKASPKAAAKKTAPKKSTPKAAPKKKPNVAAAKKAAGQRRAANALLGGLGAAGVLAVANKAISPTKPKADTTPKKRAKPGGTNKGADPKKAEPRKPSGPQTRGSAKPKRVRDLEAMSKPRASGPSTRSGAKRGAAKTITAGSNVGFGPKGNIFPSSAEDRKRLMKLYGGTGSAAAKAAAAGKQGTLKKGKK